MLDWLQASPGYWQRACTEYIPRNCLLDMMKVAGTDSRGGDLQRTVIKVIKSSEMYIQQTLRNFSHHHQQQ